MPGTDTQVNILVNVIASGMDQLKPINTEIAKLGDNTEKAVAPMQKADVAAQNMTASIVKQIPGLQGLAGNGRKPSQNLSSQARNERRVDRVEDQVRQVVTDDVSPPQPLIQRPTHPCQRRIMAESRRGPKTFQGRPERTGQFRPGQESVVIPLEGAGQAWEV